MNDGGEKRHEVIGVVGAGTIGASWTALFLAAGYEVDVHDPATGAERYVRDYVDNAWPSLEALGAVAGGDRTRLRFCAEPEAAVERADFVQESVPERIGIKHETFARIEPALRPGVLVASSASGLMVSEMQAGFADPGRLILAHPFNPPHLIPLVELYASEHSPPGALAEARVFYESCGKATITLRKEIPGHVANRLQAALWREAINLIDQDVASLEDVDTAVSSGPGLRWAVMGPNMLFNLGSGGHGMRTFCERFGPPIEGWWKTLGAPALNENVVAKLVDGIADAEHGRSFESLAAERDRKLIEILRVTRDD